MPSKLFSPRCQAITVGHNKAYCYSFALGARKRSVVNVSKEILSRSYF